MSSKVADCNGDTLNPALGSRSAQFLVGPPRRRGLGLSTLALLSLMPGRCMPRLQICSSLAKPSLRAHRHFYSTNTRILKGDDLGPTRSDAHQSFRTRKDVTAKELPLPPLLDPVILDKRSRWEQTKKRPDVANFTPFQKKLWENPFGTQSRLPV